MITQVQSFVRPSETSYYLPSASVRQAAEALDTNRDGRLGRDELEISPTLARQIDSNRDGMVQLFEVQDALDNDQLSLNSLSFKAADALAASVIRNRVFASGLGQLGYMIDNDRDGFVSRRELSQALNSGSVILSGSYLTAVQGGGPSHPTHPTHPTHPGQPWPGYGPSVEEARRTIQELEGQKMKTDNWGNLDPSTGIFKPEEANTRIKDYFDKNILNSNSLGLGEKFELIKSERMAKDNWGNYTPAKGSLKDDEVSAYAKRAAEQARPDGYRPGSERELLTAIAAERQKADNWGNDDPRSGLLKPSDANAILKKLISEEIVTTPRLSRDEKLALIKEHTMKKDNWGNELTRSGALTADEARRLSQQVFDQPAQPSNPYGNPYSNDPFGGNHGNKPGYSNDPFGKPADKPADKPYSNDPFKK